jgi:hypothetical protein
MVSHKQALVRGLDMTWRYEGPLGLLEGGQFGACLSFQSGLHEAPKNHC